MNLEDIENKGVRVQLECLRKNVKIIEDHIERTVLERLDKQIDEKIEQALKNRSNNE